MLSAARNGSERISLREIRAYCELAELGDADLRLQLCRIVLRLDETLLKAKV